jgi:hypothetical protein
MKNQLNPALGNILGNILQISLDSTSALRRSYERG